MMVQRNWQLVCRNICIQYQVKRDKIATISVRTKEMQYLWLVYLLGQYVLPLLQYLIATKTKIKITKTASICQNMTDNNIVSHCWSDFHCWI